MAFARSDLHRGLSAALASRAGIELAAAHGHGCPTAWERAVAMTLTWAAIRLVDWLVTDVCGRCRPAAVLSLATSSCSGAPPGTSQPIFRLSWPRF